MAEISLQDLKKKQAIADGTTDTAALALQVKNEMEKKEEVLSPEERTRVEEIKEQLDLLDSSQTVTYGVGAQRNISDFSDTILSRIRNKDTGEVGELLTDLMVQVKDMEIDDLDEPKGFFASLPGVASLQKRLARFQARYESVEVQIDKIEGRLDSARVQMLKDITLFDTLYQKNLEYFNNLKLYIVAGEETVHALREETLPKLRAEAQASEDPMSSQLVSDFEDTVNRFEKKVHDLKLSRQMSIQTAPQIKLIQNNDKLLVDKIQTAILNTIPLWKSQIIIATGLARQENAMKLQRSVSDTTNELLVKNAEKLKQNTIEVARESERGIVDIETLKKVNRNLIETIDETIKIQQQGHEQRARAEQELIAMEEEVKQALLQVRDRA